MQSLLYLWEPEREQKKKELTDIKDLYLEKVEPIFANAEQDADAYKNHLWEERMSEPCSGESDYIDPGIIAEEVEEESVERYFLLSLMRYRTLGLWISCLCQVWEQQLICFIEREMNKNSYEFTNCLKFNDIKICFKNHNQDFETMKSWQKIQELRWLVNVLKHGEGDFAIRLRKVRPDIFIWDHDFFSIDRLDTYKSSLLKESLKISTNDFISYYETLTEFWDELPERMYTIEG